MTPKKEARPKDRANLYSLRRNIVMNCRKTTGNLIASGKIHRHFRHFRRCRAASAQKQLTPLSAQREPDQHDSANSNDSCDDGDRPE
jgi:hypothetical protein